MISVSDLLIHDRLPANYYASDVYVRGDLEMGLLESRRGDRLLSLPETLISAIYSGLNKETGQVDPLSNSDKEKAKELGLLITDDIVKPKKHIEIETLYDEGNIPDIPDL